MSHTIRNKGQLPYHLRKEVTHIRDYVDGYTGDRWYDGGHIYMHRNFEQDVEWCNKRIAWFVRDTKNRALCGNKSNPFFCGWMWRDGGASRKNKKWIRRQWAKSNRRLGKYLMKEQLMDMEAAR